MKSAFVPRRRIGRSSRALLHLLARCPNMPTDVVAVLLGLRRPVSAAQLLARLQQMALVRTTSVAAGQLHGGRRLRVWSLTSRGMQLARALGVGRRAEDEQLLPYGAPRARRQLAGVRTLPLLIVTYRLLADIATSGNRSLRVVAFEHPWVRSIQVPGHSRSRHARFAAAAVLRPSGSADDAEATGVLLLPDVGTAPIGSFRPTLTALVAVRRGKLQKPSDEPLLVIGSFNCTGLQDRAVSWNSIVANVARRAEEPPLRVRICTDLQSTGGSHGVKTARMTQVDQAFWLLARHPLLTPAQLAILLSTTDRRVADLLHLLVDRELIEPLATHPSVGDHGTVLYQLTRRGHREATDGLLLSGPVARRYHGVLSGVELRRRRLLRNLLHTIGANAFFVDLVRAARTVSCTGGDDRLEEWRSAAAAARGRFRPDGYGCYRRGANRFGFFLEFDRGTERRSEYAAKLATYYRYRQTAATRDYRGFPTLLVVTTSQRAEDVIADQARIGADLRGGTPLRVLLTTTDRIREDGEGILGRIWRSAALPYAGADSPRSYWLQENGLRASKL